MRNEDIGSQGIIRVSGEADRTAMATLLFKNGYTVSLVRFKKNGRAYEYGIKYTRDNPDIETEDSCSKPNAVT